MKKYILLQNLLCAFTIVGCFNINIVNKLLKPSKKPTFHSQYIMEVKNNVETTIM